MRGGKTPVSQMRLPLFAPLKPNTESQDDYPDSLIVASIFFSIIPIISLYNPNITLYKPILSIYMLYCQIR